MPKPARPAPLPIPQVDRLAQFREYLQPMPTGALVAALGLTGSELQQMLLCELADRGLLKDGTWVGFLAAKQQAAAAAREAA